eukprot:gb/GFBE01014348.1/.p1 GENE.gb/GFBE01014348.1/~~gb/GFBE01014348.1/.p1  ORF type:complete len:117 (+),score=17.18 gb/GFBE01014348.1/:1-351(+)
MVSPARTCFMVACLHALLLTSAAEELCSAQEEATHGPSNLLQVAERKTSVDVASATQSRSLAEPLVRDGLAVIRVPKTGSSTMKLVGLRLGSLYGLNNVYLRQYVAAEGAPPILLC